MAVTYHDDGPLGFITLDKPPANSYDLAFMIEFAEAVDEALVGATRVVIVQSASEKFFSAGADIKRFLDGDVDSNMEMTMRNHWSPRASASCRARAKMSLIVLYSALACHHGTKTM